MKYRCKCCNRFIADIRGRNNMDLNGKIELNDKGQIVITCKCGAVTVIDIDEALEKNKKTIAKIVTQ